MPRSHSGGLPGGFWRIRARVARYPMGFDLFAFDGARLVGLGVRRLHVA